MNSKELVEQAKDTINKQLGLIDDIEKAERSLELAKTGKICFCAGGYDNVYLEDTTEPEAMEVVRDLGLTAIMNYRDDKTKELEELLGVRHQEPDTIITTTFVPTGAQHIEIIPAPDPVEDKLSAILEGEAKKIEDKPIPPIMTVSLVKELYHDKDMTLDRVAKVFEVNPSALYRFVVANNLRKPRGKEPETECPTDTE